MFSYGRTLVRGETDVIDFSRTWWAGGDSDAQYRLGMTLIGSSNDVKKGYGPQPNNFRIKAQYLDGFGPWSFGLGVSVGQNVDDFNGSKMNFALSIEYRFTKLPLVIQYAHDSNAGTVQPNDGRDYILVGYRFH
jgi:predicted porin